MMKLSSGEEVHPFLRVVGAEDAKVCFNLLIGSFGLSICLRVICGGKFDIVVEESCQFSSKCRGELGPLSDIKKSWRLKHLNTWWRKCLATLAASMVLEQGMRITPFVRPWSTTTINESCLLEGGREVMRLTESCLNGRGQEEGMG